MKKINCKKFKLEDIVGAGCGVIVLLIMVAHIIVGALPVVAGVKNSEVPADAYLYTGSAPGRNSEIVVQVVASSDKIYQIWIHDNEETANIGTVAIREMPRRIFETQSLAADSVSGATVTSIAVKSAVLDALKSGGIDTVPFGVGTPKGAEIPAPTTMTDAALAEYYGSAVFTDVHGGKVSDAGTVVYGSGYGAFSDVLVAVLFDNNDSIIGLIVDASGETPEKGIKCQEREFTDRFIGATSGKDVDVLSGASFTSWGVQDAVDYALENLSTVKAG